MNMKNLMRAIAAGAMLMTVNIAASTEIPAFYKEVIEKTIANNPEVQVKLHAYTAALEGQKIAKSNYYPHADLIYKARSQQQMTPNIGNTETPERQAQFVITQMLFDGFATPAEVGRLGHMARVRYYELQAAMQDIALQTTTAYINVQRGNDLVKFAESNYVAHKLIFDRIEERVGAGVARKVDLEQASGRLALAEANLLTEMTNLQNTTAAYQRLTGDMPTQALPKVVFRDDDELKDAAKVLNAAFRANPTFLAASENILATEQEVRGKRAGYMPKLDLRATTNPYTSENGENSSLVADTLELTGSFNIFNGFKDQANIAQSVENLNGAFDLQDKACRDLRQEVSIAQNDVSSLHEQVQFRNTHQLAIEKAREAYKKQFDIGQRTLLDLLDTENEYFQARRSYVNAVDDLSIALARTYAAEGALLTEAGITTSDLPPLEQSEANQNYAICEAIAPMMLEIDKEALLAAARESEATGKMEEEKIVLSDKVDPPVEFEPRSARLKTSSFRVLDAAVEILKDWGDAKVEVAGHTDRRSTSKAEYNQRLSEKRAKAVADYLVKKGIDRGRLTVRGYGFNQPIAENDPKTGNSANRRVELVRKK